MHTISFGIVAYLTLFELLNKRRGMTVFGLASKLIDRPNRPEIALLLWIQYSSNLFIYLFI